MQQPAPTFAELVSALPPNYHDVEHRALGVHETMARLKFQLEYWNKKKESGGGDDEGEGGGNSFATAASSGGGGGGGGLAPGVKAAEQTCNYIQHLVDRGGHLQPKCPISIGGWEIIAKEFMTVKPECRVGLKADYASRGIEFDGDQDQLRMEELVQLSILRPKSADEAVAYCPQLGRFEDDQMQSFIERFIKK